MLYLIKNFNFCKIGYAENVLKRLQSYYTQNPYVELLGIKDGTEIEERQYHIKYQQYMPVKFSEWMILPNNILKELKQEFEIPTEFVFLNVNDKKLIQDYLNNDTKLEEFCTIKNLDITYIKDNISNKSNKLRKLKYGYLTLEGRKAAIEINRNKVCNYIREAITYPIKQGEVKKMLQQYYDSIGLQIKATAKDVTNIWLPEEYECKVIWLTGSTGGYVYPKNYQFYNHKEKKVKKTSQNNIVTIYNSVTEANLKNGYTADGPIYRFIKEHKHSPKGDYYEYIV